MCVRVCVHLRYPIRLPRGENFDSISTSKPCGKDQCQAANNDSFLSNTHFRQFLARTSKRNVMARLCNADLSQSILGNFNFKRRDNNKDAGSIARKEYHGYEPAAVLRGARGPQPQVPRFR